MTRRLLQLCRMVPSGGIGFADIGTDHGYIPVWLAKNGYTGNIYAYDIAEAPLKRAIAHAREEQFEQRIHFSVSDGLDMCPADRVDCIMIAGMGGDTICRILDRAEWIMNSGYILILQPMTHPEVLRYWLMHNEFQITREAVIAEDSHVYQMFCAESGLSASASDAEYFVGSIDTVHTGDPVTLLYLDVMKKIRQKLDGMCAAHETEHSRYRFYNEIYYELKHMYECACQVNQDR